MYTFVGFPQVRNRRDLVFSAVIRGKYRYFAAISGESSLHSQYTTSFFGIIVPSKSSIRVYTPLSRDFPLFTTISPA